MTDEKKKYPRKFVNFDPDNKEEMDLYQWLRRLGFGDFSKETKAYWLKKMKEEQPEPTETVDTLKEHYTDHTTKLLNKIYGEEEQK